eukprot:365413-Chlamydomonas_euryale.AAC.6
MDALWVGRGGWQPTAGASAATCTLGGRCEDGHGRSHLHDLVNDIGRRVDDAADCRVDRGVLYDDVNAAILLQREAEGAQRARTPRRTPLRCYEAVWKIVWAAVCVALPVTHTSVRTAASPPPQPTPQTSPPTCTWPAYERMW